MEPTMYCPRCENPIHPMLTHDCWDCPICENILFLAECDEYPGETHGKPRPEAVL